MVSIVARQQLAPVDAVATSPCNSLLQLERMNSGQA